jgi:hypothetical protein
MLQIGFELLFRCVWGWLLATSLTAAIRERVVWPYLLLVPAMTIPFLMAKGESLTSDALNFYLGGFLIGSAAFMCLPFDRDSKTLRERRKQNFSLSVKILLVALLLRGLELAFMLVRLEPIKNVGPFVDEMGRPILAPQVEVFQSFNAAESYLSLKGHGLWNLGPFGQLCLTTRLLWGLVIPFVLLTLTYQRLRRSNKAPWPIELFGPTLLAMIILGEGTALYLNFALGWNL